MAKETTKETAKALVLSAGDAELIKGLSKEDLKEFNELSDAEKKGVLVALQMKKTGHKEVEVTKLKMDEDQATDPMIAVNSLGFKAGDTIVARFMGTVPMFSKEEKENWKKISYDNKIFFESSYFRFEREDGTTFGLYGYSGLAMLHKVHTKANNPTLKQNPMVSIKYIGLIEGKERLKAEFGITLTSGNSSHVFDLGIEKTAIVERYTKGVLNYLKAPFPTFANSSDDQKDPHIIAQENWDRQQAIIRQAADASKQIGHEETLRLN